MKKISSLLVAIVVLLTMVSTVAFASGAELYLSEVTYGGSGNITVSVLCNTSFDANVAEVYGYFNYDPELFDLVSEPDGCYDDGGCIEVWLEPVTAAVVADEAIVTFEFAPKGDIIGYEFVMEEAAILSNNEKLFSENISTTVKEAKKDPVKVPQEAISAQAGTFDIYENVVVLSVDVALDAAAQGYGFDLTNGTKTKTFDLGDAVSGDGELEYVVAFWGVPADVTITATPWVLK